MLTFAGTEDRQSSSLIFVSGATRNGSVSLISDSSSLLGGSLLSSNSFEDTCSFYSGPSDATILAFGESAESCGSVAYDSAAGISIAYSGSAESCGSIASSSFSSSGCCSYTC